MTWQLIYTKQAQKDTRKFASSGLKERAKELLKIVQSDPYQKSAPLREVGRRSCWRIFAPHQHPTPPGVSGAREGARRESAPPVDPL